MKIQMKSAPNTSVQFGDLKVGEVFTTLDGDAVGVKVSSIQLFWLKMTDGDSGRFVSGPIGSGVTYRRPLSVSMDIIV